jgi:hypothetical protein
MPSAPVAVRLARSWKEGVMAALKLIRH